MTRDPPHLPPLRCHTTLPHYASLVTTVTTLELATKSTPRQSHTSKAQQQSTYYHAAPAERRAIPLLSISDSKIRAGEGSQGLIQNVTLPTIKAA